MRLNRRGLVSNWDLPWGAEAVVAAIVAIYCQLPMTHMLATVFASSSDHHELSKATVVDARTAEGAIQVKGIELAIRVLQELAEDSYAFLGGMGWVLLSRQCRVCFQREWACSSRHAVGAALLLTVAMLPGCSDVGLPNEEMPASGAYPWYNDLVANHLKKTFTNRASYDAFAISAFRWVHSLKGWAWMTCVHFRDSGHPRTYAVFIKDGKVIDGRYAVQTDACNTQTYAAFDAMGPTRAGVLEPLY